MNIAGGYRGRLAPSPTGYLHVGHARTFWVAQERARAAGGTMLLRVDDLDAARCKPEFVAGMYEDLRWFGFTWSEGPDVGGPCGPYCQSERTAQYRRALELLLAGGWVYPCTCSRADIQAAVRAPHAADDELIYPGTCRGRSAAEGVGGQVSWRFRVPDGESIEFVDGHFGRQALVAGRDFGDFVLWRGDHVPSYQLACVVDDAAMGITEVVRGADLLVSTARQVLLYRALGFLRPAFYHCELMRDGAGQRLAKRHDALSLREMRARGENPAKMRENWGL